MHLFFIRHGETEHNIAGLLAGVTDSRLTNHGALQTQRLGSSLVKDRGLRFTNVYSSDLQRAFLTANEICKAQNSIDPKSYRVEVVKLEALRECDFGSLELVSWTSRHAEDLANPSRSKPGNTDFRDKESAESMRARANAFLDDYFIPLSVSEDEDTTTVAIVSHGIFLGHLWRALLARFEPRSVSISPSVETSMGQPIEHMSWSNTGYLEVDIQFPKSSEPVIEQALESSQIETTSSLPKATMTIMAINSKHHLLNLKRARGGIGSGTYDQRQQSLQTFFKKPKVESKDVG